MEFIAEAGWLDVLIEALKDAGIPTFVATCILLGCAVLIWILRQALDIVKKRDEAYLQARLDTDGVQLKARLDAQLKIADRYAMAVNHLGSTEEMTRIGGIYELGLLLNLETGSTDDYYWPVMDLLTPFVRLKMQFKEGDKYGNHLVEIDEDIRWLPEDVQAALNVIGQRITPRPRPNDSPVDLSWTDLRSAWLVGAHLEWSYFGYSNLDNADMEGSLLDHADLERTSFKGADLTNASFINAKFRKTDFTDAILDGVKLTQDQCANVIGLPEGFKPTHV